jgi:hypothetical protein
LKKIQKEETKGSILVNIPKVEKIAAITYLAKAVCHIAEALDGCDYKVSIIGNTIECPPNGVGINIANDKRGNN